MKDTTIREILFGSGVKLEKPIDRSQIITYPIAKNGERYRSYQYRKDDGFILCLIEMIEKLEERIGKLEVAKKK